MKQQLLSLYVALFFVMAPSVGHAVSADQPFEKLQLQINSAYYAGDHVRVIELFSVMLELLWSDSVRHASLNPKPFEVITGDVRDINTHSARVHAQVSWGSADRGYMWFEYGESRDELDHMTSRERIDEDDDTYHHTLSGLEHHERYYYRAVVEDRKTDTVYRGEVEHFRTPDKREVPEIKTHPVTQIRTQSVQVRGLVDMNDYHRGVVFVVWGEDEHMVEDIADEYEEYRDIEVGRDNLRKRLVERRVDGRSGYDFEIDRLEADTRYAFSICLEYEHDDDEVIVCGKSEKFQTED